MSKTFAITLAVLVAATHAHGAEFLNSPEQDQLDLPFSDAVKTGNLLILSGKLGTLPGTMKLAPGGIKAEARQVMENIKHSLEQHGYGMENIIKCTVMMADISEWAAFNEVYVQYFPGPKPARSAFGASGLALGGRLEVECWAEVD